MRGPAMPTTAPGSPRRSTTGCSSPARRAPRISSRPRTAPTRPAPPPPRPRSRAYLARQQAPTPTLPRLRGRELIGATLAKKPSLACVGGCGLSAQPRAFVDREDADSGAVDVDRADRALAHLDAVVVIERHAEREEERGADHIAVADHQHRLVQMALADFHQRLNDSALHLAHVLAAGDPRQAALGSPGLPARVGADRIEGRAGPFAEIELDQIIVKRDRQIEAGGDDLRALAGALQGARIDRGDFFAGETLGNCCDFGAAALGEADPRHAAGEHPAQETVLAVAQQVKDRHAVSLDPAQIVIPAKAGIHCPAGTTLVGWIPAFAGMTM